MGGRLKFISRFLAWRSIAEVAPVYEMASMHASPLLSCTLNSNVPCPHNKTGLLPLTACVAVAGHPGLGALAPARLLLAGVGAWGLPVGAGGGGLRGWRSHCWVHGTVW